MNKPLLWKTYWLYIGTEPIQSVLLPVGATEAQVKETANRALDVIPALAYPSAPYERRGRIAWATVVSDDHSFERTTPEKYWGFIPDGLLCDPPEPPQPESPWETARRAADAARARVMIRRQMRLSNFTDDLGPAI